MGGDYTITPQLDANHLNGVSTFDLVLIVEAHPGDPGIHESFT